MPGLLRIAENNFGVSRGEKAYAGCADAAGTACDERYLTGQGERNGHGKLVSGFLAAFASGTEKKGEDLGHPTLLRTHR
jgi:hypothetical protein